MFRPVNRTTDKHYLRLAPVMLKSIITIYLKKDILPSFQSPKRLHKIRDILPVTNSRITHCIQITRMKFLLATKFNFGFGGTVEVNKWKIPRHHFTNIFPFIIIVVISSAPFIVIIIGIASSFQLERLATS